MGFWHTGYIEFHEPSGLEGVVYNPPPPPRYVCEYCNQDFAELDELRRHRFERHPLRQPILLLRGKAVGMLPVQVMTPLKTDDIVVEDATQCSLNGRSVLPSLLGEQLSLMRREFVELELVNSEARTRCQLDFRVADEVHLAGVETAFMRMVRERTLSIEAVSRFIEECRYFDSALSYYDGICLYLYGVIAKEKSPDSGLQPSQYTERYLQAKEKLEGFERPLARTIRRVAYLLTQQKRQRSAHQSDGLA